ncbi:tyrosine-protein phosphatase [Candidatus Chloroploca sp. Khr17]|uniref:tyrosine-protein phosphatase n=1 Tax=Candidatus Chloroploca sp. Khr17 TaxID=2496869 RepID=UPI00101D2665|nr:CpsB/CapC family capsule biosynthesis tyrosine phosphatase [Candidatus Chloroploca sp. Khr17]
MIDLHSHILHNIDDGTRSLQEAVALARAAVADGVTIMAATPHGASSVSTWTRYEVKLAQQRLAELRAALAHEDVPLQLIAGTEIYGEPGALERLQAGALLPYETGRAVLVEFPLHITPQAAEQIIFGFQLAGYRVVLAHPERYHFVLRDPNTLIPMIERGIVMQLTCDALLGVQGSRMKMLGELMVQHGLVQILATDAHGLHLGRVPNLGAARIRVAQLVSEDLADALTRLHPEAILADASLTPMPPSRIRNWDGSRYA